MGYIGLGLIALSFVAHGFAFSRAKSHFIPATLPFFAPYKRSLANGADLARQIRFFTHTGHRRIIAGFVVGLLI
jgi:hypothetical protein